MQEDCDATFEPAKHSCLAASSSLLLLLLLLLHCSLDLHDL
jgi:hypothetical protein